TSFLSFPTRRSSDLYMTAYFNAWLDNHNLYGADKRWVVAFSPWLATEADDRTRFFTDYPEGRLIRIVRDPCGWYASASTSKPGRSEEHTSELQSRGH